VNHFQLSIVEKNFSSLEKLPVIILPKEKDDFIKGEKTGKLVIKSSFSRFKNL